MLVSQNGWHIMILCERRVLSAQFIRFRTCLVLCELTREIDRVYFLPPLMTQLTFLKNFIEP